MDNWFVLHRLEPALAQHRKLQRWLGPSRARRLAHWLGHNIAGLAGNISLGVMLGMVPAIAAFFGLPLDVRHVTLSTGQVTAALAALGPESVRQAATLRAIVGILGIGALNLLVSFGLALFVTIRARNFSAPGQTARQGSLEFHSAGGSNRLRIPERCRFLMAPRSAEFGVVILARAGGHGLQFQRHAALGAIAGMILLHFRVHRAGVNGLARRGRDPRRIAFQCHAAFRTIARFVRLQARIHGAKVFCRGGRLHRCVAVVVTTGIFSAPCS